MPLVRGSGFLHKTGGFTLIECLVYCALLMPLGFLAMSGMHKLKCYLDRAYISSRGNLELLAIRRIINTDVRASLIDAKNWCMIPYIVWQRYDEHDATTWVGYELRNKKLLRHEGSFDAMTKSWHHKKTSLIAHAIRQFEVDLEQCNDELFSKSPLIKTVRIRLTIAVGEAVREELMEFYPFQSIKSASIS